jgi:hypothetical protein
MSSAVEEVLLGNYKTLILILFQLVEKCIALCNRPILILIQLVDKFVALCNKYKDHMMFPNKQYLYPTPTPHRSLYHTEQRQEH